MAEQYKLALLEPAGAPDQTPRRENGEGIAARGSTEVWQAMSRIGIARDMPRDCGGMAA
jgi:hypothetical protein